MSLRNQIHMRIFTAVIISLITGSGIAIWDAKQSVREEVTSSFKLVQTILEFTTALQKPLDQNSQLWTSYVSSMQAVRHIKIERSTSVNHPHNQSQNNVISKEPPPLWFVQIMTNDLPKLRREITLPGDPQSMVIQADPSDEIIEAWQEFLTLFWSIVAIQSVLLVSISMISHTILNAVQNILTNIKMISCGNFSSSTIPNSNIDEFDIIAKGLKELAIQLKVTQENNRELTYHSLNIQERERKTIAQELHDEMGQSLTAIKAMAVAIQQQQKTHSVASETIIRTCNHLTTIIRSRMRTLHPLSLAELGLEDTLNNLINEWSATHSAIQIDMLYDNPLKNISNQVGIHIYRIIQECLNNIAKHSKASEVKIQLKSDLQHISLSIIDNGIGFTHAPHNQGFGLRGITERAESQGGTLKIKKNSDGGLAIYTYLPLHGEIHEF